MPTDKRSSVLDQIAISNASSARSALESIPDPPTDDAPGVHVDDERRVGEARGRADAKLADQSTALTGEQRTACRRLHPTKPATHRGRSPATRRNRWTWLLWISWRRQHLNHALAHLLQLHAYPRQHVRCDTFSLSEQPKKNVLGSDVVVTELQRFSQPELENLLRPRRERNMTQGCLSAITDDLLHPSPRAIEGDTQRDQPASRDAIPLVEDPKRMCSVPMEAAPLPGPVRPPVGRDQ